MLLFYDKFALNQSNAMILIAYYNLFFMTTFIKQVPMAGIQFIANLKNMSILLIFQLR